MSEKVYELRGLQSQDLFPVLSLLNKIGISEIKTVFNGESVQGAIKKMKAKEGEGNDGDKKDEIMASVGISVAMEIAGILMTNLPKCENEVYNILSSLSGMKPKAIRELSPAIFAEMILDVVTKEEFKDFFKVVSKYFK